MSGERIPCEHRWTTVEREDEFRYQIGSRILVLCPECAARLGAILAGWLRDEPVCLAARRAA